ncbi:MAG: UDP-N-acetylmuramate dehydrogenase [Oscillospiraceae bacterium]|jgi:UDP-N-acetylmuramate dehydrogenase|nr:UDP-N-acetylmuramate dehydrogenase [Oscillospiraceae bacterium]
MNYDFLVDIAKSYDCKILLNEPMCKHTSFKIGGSADVFLFVNSLRALKKILLYIFDNQIPYYVLGNGCNLLVPDEGFRGVILKLSGDFLKISLVKEDIISCKSGVKLSELCRFAAKHSLSGLEFAWGIPATVGGAVFMNAGAYDGEIKNVLISCVHVDDNLKEVTLNKDELVNFGYRTSVYSTNKNIITTAVFKLKISNRNEIQRKMDTLFNRRKDKQPMDYPSAGSIFKRPTGYFVGKLIDDCGLRGTSIGGAKISDKHSGFIVNTGGATCEDVVNLINLAKNRVLKNSGVALDTEIKILKN